MSKTETEPSVSAEIEPTVLTIPALDGYPLEARLFTPAKDSRALVILNSATGVQQRYYQAFAEATARLGFTVLTYDYRGIGGSRQGDLRGFEARMEDWARLDFGGVLRWSADQASRRFVIGHSFGGQAIGFTPGADQLDGGIFIAVQSGYWRHWSGAGRLRLFLLWHGIIPLVCRLRGFLPGSLGIGEDLPSGVARQWARWGRHPEYAFGHLAEAKDLAARVRWPILALSFSDDGYAPRRSVDAILSYFSSAEREHRHLKPHDFGLARIDHFGFFKKRHTVLWRLAHDRLETLSHRSS